MGFFSGILSPFNPKHAWDNPGGYLVGKYVLKNGQGTVGQRLNAIQINRSAYGAVMPLVYGMTRIAINLMWYGGFKATAHTEKQQGGKGVSGGGGGSNTTYTYSAAIVGGLCEGQINGLANYWVDKEKHTSLSDLGLTLFSGAGGQTTWSYLTTNFSAQAIPYDHTAYIAASALDLGSSASLPNLAFEVRGLQCYNPGGAVYDAEPSDIIIDYCTEANHGCNFPFLGTLQGIDTGSYESYCIAMGFFISPQETQQRAAVSFLGEMLQITNSDAVWSPGIGLRIVPYADASVTGNSRTYTPDLTPLYALGDNDYLHEDGEDPIRVTRTPPSQTFNKVRVEFLDRTQDYNTAIAEATDDQDISLNGERVMPTVTLHAITTLAVARQVAQLILQRQLYIRNTFQFSLRADYSLLEPMDLLSITDTTIGVINQLVRITQTDDSEDDVFSVTAEEMLVGTAGAPRYNTQAAAGYIANYAVAPGAVQAPLIFTAPQYLVDVNGGYEVWIALAGATHATWGGCVVYYSIDGTQYIRLGVHAGPSRYGALTATFASGSDPDTTNTLSVSMADANMTLVSGTQQDADDMRTLLYVDGEICSYRYATLTAPGAYTFTSNGTSGGSKYMRRGKYGSSIASHASASKWARIDDGLFRVPYDPGSIGRTVHFKFQSFNVYGAAYEDLSAVTVYDYVLQDANAGVMLPNNATFIARGSCVIVGDKMFKNSAGSSAFDSDVYSSEAYAAGCVLKFRPAATLIRVLVGLNSDPLTDSSYTSLDHAWYCNPSGQLEIYENAGQAVTAFGSYDTTTLLETRYDGIAVRYYKDGVLIREVQNPGKVFFMDSSFYQPNDAIKDVFFGAASSTPSSRLLARGNCIVVGNTIQKVGGTDAWDSDCYSAETYDKGVAVSFTNQCKDADDYMIGLNSDPTTNRSYTSLDFAIQVYSFPDGGPSFIIYESGTAVTSASAASVGEVFSIQYDGEWVRYYRNGGLIREKSAPGLTLFMDSSFFHPGAVATDVTVGPLTTATPNPFLARGNCKISGDSISKFNGSSAWDSDAYSIKGYPTCHVSFKPTYTEDVMVGLNADPTTDQSYTSIDYAWYVQTTGNVIGIYESGSSIGNFGTYTPQTLLAITYDGTNIRYYKDDLTTAVRTVAASGLTLFMDSAFYTPGSAVNSVRFGPSTNLAVTDTPQIGANAATTTGLGRYDLLNTSPGVPNGTYFRPPESELVITGPGHDCTVIVTAQYQAYVNFPFGSSPVYARCAFADNGSAFSYSANETTVSTDVTIAVSTSNIVQAQFPHSKANAGVNIKANLAFYNASGTTITTIYGPVSVQVEFILR